jgi:hypothetical protein
VHRRLRAVDSSYPGDGLSHLVEQRVSEADAKAAYARTVAWFTECDSRSIPGSKSLKKVFHQRELHGVASTRDASSM